MAPHAAMMRAQCAADSDFYFWNVKARIGSLVLIETFKPELCYVGVLKGMG